MKIQIGRWGNSLAIRIPSGLAKEAGLFEGASVDAVVAGASIVLRPASKSYTLDDLMQGMTRENVRSETDWGQPEAGEEW